MSDGKSDPLGLTNDAATSDSRSESGQRAIPSTVVGQVPAAVRLQADSISPATVVGTVMPVMPTPMPAPGWVTPSGLPSAAPPALVSSGHTPRYASSQGSHAGPIPYHLPSPDAASGLPAPPWVGYEQDHGRERWHRAATFMKLHLSRAVARDLRSVAVTAPETPILAAHGVYDHTIQQYLLWRRSWLYLLMPLAVVAAVIQLVAFFTEDIDTSTMSWFGIIMLGGTVILQMLGYPIAAAFAVWRWDRLAFSRRVLVAGWFVSYLLPFLVALIPFGHFIVIDETDPEIIQGQRFGAGIAGAMVWLFWLLPALLAIMPGVLRASVRIKSLLPESVVPGWLIVMTAPFFTLVLLVVFVMVNQVAGNLLLIVGVLLLMASPAVFLIRTDLLIKPVTEQSDRRRLEAMQVVYIIAIGLGMACLMMYVYTLDILGKPVVGNPDDPVAPAMTTVVRFSWEVISFVITYSAKSVFVTAVATDLFMLLNLSVWKNLKAFEGTPHAIAYDRTMGSFQALAEGRDDANLPFATPATHAFEVVRPPDDAPLKLG